VGESNRNWTMRGEHLPPTLPERAPIPHNSSHLASAHVSSYDVRRKTSGRTRDNETDDRLVGDMVGSQRNCIAMRLLLRRLFILGTVTRPRHIESDLLGVGVWRHRHAWEFALFHLPHVTRHMTSESRTHTNRHLGATTHTKTTIQYRSRAAYTFVKWVKVGWKGK